MSRLTTGIPIDQRNQLIEEIFRACMYGTKILSEVEAGSLWKVLQRVHRDERPWSYSDYDTGAKLKAIQFLKKDRLDLHTALLPWITMTREEIDADR